MFRLPDSDQKYRLVHNIPILLHDSHSFVLKSSANIQLFDFSYYHQHPSTHLKNLGFSRKPSDTATLTNFSHLRDLIRMARTADQIIARKLAAWDDHLDQTQNETLPAQISTPRGAMQHLLGSSLLFGSFQEESPLAAPDSPIHNQEYAHKTELVQYASTTTATDSGWQVGHYRSTIRKSHFCRLDALPPEIQMLILGFASDFPTFVHLTQSTSRLMAVYNENRERLHAKVMLRVLKDKGFDAHHPTTWLEVSLLPRSCSNLITASVGAMRKIPSREEFENRGLSLETTIQDIYYQIATNRPVSLTSSQCWLLGYIDQAVGLYTSTSRDGAEHLWCTRHFSNPIARSTPDLFMTFCFGTRTADDLKLLKSRLPIRNEPSEDATACVAPAVLTTWPS